MSARPAPGHFVKMVHNGIEYGLMQAYGEGFEIMHASEYDLDFAPDLRHLALRLGRPLLAARAPARRVRPSTAATSTDIAGYVADSGEGRWTVDEAINESVPAPAMTLALFMRFASRQDESFAAKVSAALREQFGGHAVKTQMTDTELAENPLLAGLGPRRAPEPCALVIFGASGDLTHRKIFPALYALAYRRLLPERFAVVGAARSDWSDDEFRGRMESAVREFGRDDFKQEVWDRLAEGTHYLPMDFADEARRGQARGAPERPRRGARHPRQPRLLPRRPAGRDADDRPAARQAAPKPEGWYAARSSRSRSATTSPRRAS